MALPHAITGGAPLTLAGRCWWLRITYRVLLECEELSGVDMLAASLDVARPSARLMRVLLWASLRSAGASWTLPQVGSHLTLGNLASVHEAVLAAWKASMSAPGPARKGNASAPAKPTTWTEAWATARQGLGLSDAEWLEMTPRQLNALRQVQLERLQREEYLVGIVASTVANYGFRAPTSAMNAESFMIHQFEDGAADAGPLTGEAIMAALRPIKENLRKVS